jgi:ketosteroid isomerase-like protein
MKIIVPFFASLFLAAMTFAQEESPAPTESSAPASEEKASATVETTPEAAPAESTAPVKKAEAAAPSPAKAAKNEAAATTATAAKPANGAKPAAPAAAAAPKMNMKNMSVKDMENAWEASVPKHDFKTVEGFVAADFTGVSSKGKFVNRSQMLSEYKGDKDTYKSAKNEKLNVTMFGPTVTVVTGRAREIGTGKDGKAFDRTFLFTDTWMMRGGKWQCVASQSSKIKG